MNSRRIRRFWLQRLETRCLPAGTVSLVSSADSDVIIDTAGGDSEMADPFDLTGGIIGQRKRVSADGRFTVFTSNAANLVAGQLDTNGANDVFLFDRLLSTTTLVSHRDGLAEQAAN